MSDAKRQPLVGRAFPQFRTARVRLNSKAAMIIGGAVVGLAMPAVASATVVVGTPGKDHLVATSPNGDTLYGGGGPDELVGGPGNDVLYGVRSGNTISGGGGDDYIEGGTGDDTITAGEGNNTVFGGPGNDSITAGDGNNYIDPGGAIDQVTLGNGNNVVNGGAGGMFLKAGNGNNTVYYRSGPDEITLGSGVNNVYIGIINQLAKVDCGGNPQSTLYVNRQQDPTLGLILAARTIGKVIGCPNIVSFDGPAIPISVSATKTQSFRLIGTDAVDKLYGGHGGGFIDGKGGNNILWADREHDTGGSFARGKKTTIQASDGDNEIYGGRGTNVITVGSGRNFIRGGAFNNTITTNGGDNSVRLQGKGTNTVTFGGGSNYIESFATGPKPRIFCNVNATAIVLYGVRKPITDCKTVVNVQTKRGQKLAVQGIEHILPSDPVVSFPLQPGQNGIGIARPTISAAL